MINWFKRVWHLWAKALGEKAADCDQEADKIAFIRTFLILQAVITNMFIILNFFVTHWAWIIAIL